jgi:hypothetical protein
MKECMARHATNNDGSTKAQIQTACRAEVKNATPDTSNYLAK